MARKGFETVLNGCLTSLQQGGSVEDCLKQYPAEAERLRPLLEAAADLANLAPPADLRSEGGGAAREKFLRAAARYRSALPLGSRWRTPALDLMRQLRALSVIQRISVTAATVVVLTLLFSGANLFVSAHELEGVVESIDADDAGNKVLLVAGKTVIVDSSADIEGPLAVGVEVRIQGSWESDDLLVAHEVEASGVEIEFSGLVISVGDTWIFDSDEGPIEVRVTSDTELEHLPNGDAAAAVGKMAKVGAVETSHGLVASKIEISRGHREQELEEIEFRGTVESISGSVWVIDDWTVMVDEDTELKKSPGVGDRVDVRAVVQADGSLLAVRIEAKGEGDREDHAGRRVEFEGRVESIWDSMWMIDGRPVLVDEGTELMKSPGVGDLVEVRATAQPDGTLPADRIETKKEKDTEDGEESGGEWVEFKGTVLSISGSIWMIDDWTVMVDGDTELKKSPGVGDEVEVRGSVQADGSLLAVRIEAKGERDREDGEASGGEWVEFRGTVLSISGSIWMIDEWTVMVDEDTELKKSPGVGDEVEVRGSVQADGSLLAARIETK